MSRALALLACSALSALLATSSSNLEHSAVTKSTLRSSSAPHSRRPLAPTARPPPPAPRGHQSQKGRENIPVAGTNHRLLGPHSTGDIRWLPAAS
eukprot:689810-Prorocentrum_minimum.AAC.3